MIPNTLSPADFRMMDKELSRKELSLPDKHIILFGAARIDDPIKGVEYLLRAIRLLIEKKQFPQEKLHLALFGKIKYPEKLLSSIPVSYTYLGRIGDTNKLSQLYSAADVTVSASFYETFGQTLIEAQACGCIPVSFGNSGQADIIRTKRTASWPTTSLPTAWQKVSDGEQPKPGQPSPKKICEAKYSGNTPVKSLQSNISISTKT